MIKSVTILFNLVTQSVVRVVAKRVHTVYTWYRNQLIEFPELEDTVLRTSKPSD